MTQLSFWAIRAWEYLLFWILYWGDTTLGDSGSDILSIELSRMQIDDAAKEKLMETSLCWDYTVWVICCYCNITAYDDNVTTTCRPKNHLVAQDDNLHEKSEGANKSR